jgi:hypothetical protein
VAFADLARQLVEELGGTEVGPPRIRSAFAFASVEVIRASASRSSSLGHGTPHDETTELGRSFAGAVVSMMQR